MDTYYMMEWTDFKNLIIENNFIIEMIDTSYEESIIAYNKKGLILFANSYNNHLNNGDLYSEIESNDNQEYNLFLEIGSGGQIANTKIFQSSIDVRDNLFSKIANLESYGNFLETWTGESRFLWFLNFEETNLNHDNYEEITTKKIEQCPEVKKIINR